jgi:hypothetical protein
MSQGGQDVCVCVCVITSLCKGIVPFRGGGGAPLARMHSKPHHQPPTTPCLYLASPALRGASGLGARKGRQSHTPYVLKGLQIRGSGSPGGLGFLLISAPPQKM